MSAAALQDESSTLIAEISRLLRLNESLCQRLQALGVDLQRAYERFKSLRADPAVASAASQQQQQQQQQSWGGAALQQRLAVSRSARSSAPTDVDVQAAVPEQAQSSSSSRRLDAIHSDMISRLGRLGSDLQESESRLRQQQRR
jgi:hypothetical protein